MTRGLRHGGLCPILITVAALVAVGGGAAQADPSAPADSLDIWLEMLGVGEMSSAVPAPSVPIPIIMDLPGWSWSGSLSTGYDGFIQTYALALEDTTDTLNEFEVSVGVDGVTSGPRVHHLRLSPRATVGSERTREQLEFAWSWKPDSTISVFDLQADLQSVQYRETSAWSLNSNWSEADLSARWRLSPQGATAGELRLDASNLRYTDSSELEVDRDEVKLSAAVRSGRDADARWKFGLRTGRRVHPDTSSIDRDSWGVEGEYETLNFEGPSLRAAHRSVRRDVRDETARPSSWGHWSAVDGALPIGDELEIATDMDFEHWDYDTSWGAYQDQTRWAATAGLQRPAGSSTGWQLGVAWEHLLSDDDDEVYDQLGVRGGLETFGRNLSATLTLEVGKRDYEAASEDEVAAVSLVDIVDEPLYTDFSYVELWLSANWRLDDHVSLDVLASYLPESHSNDEDDQSLGFASVRAVYRF